METVLTTCNLVKRYKKFTALNNLNIHIEKGSIYGLIGKNGAGKTTLIRIICGLQNPTAGSYAIYGTDNKSGNMTNVRKRMGAIIETPSIYDEMTAGDNLRQQCKLAGEQNPGKVDELLKLVGLENTGKKKAKDFSLGMKQRLGIAVALVGDPDFLILDEPINGLDPQGIIEIRELILKLNQEKNITILISSHYLDELSKIATHYGFLDNGSIIKEISNTELMKNLEHKIELKVSNPEDFAACFAAEQIPYEQTDSNTIVVYGKRNLVQFINTLSQNHLIAEDIHEHEESLESYYMNLIGGDRP